MADTEQSLGALLDKHFKKFGPVRKRVGASGPYYAKPADALRDPNVIEAIKQADALAERLNLRS